jgi:hypothetical protein
VILPVPRFTAVWSRVDHSDVVIALTASDRIQLAIAAITALATLIALGNVAVTFLSERRRGQPIVIAHEAGARRFASDSEPTWWAVDAYLTSEGAGPAFNVRFGVEFAGVRYPYRLTNDDPEPGNIQRVLRSGERRPDPGSWAILIDSLSMWGRTAEAEGDLDAKRVYWARYENAQGQTWETRNPGDRSARLDIRRIRYPAAVEFNEKKRREEAGQHDAEWVRQALDELRALRAKTEAEEAKRVRAEGTK